MAAFEWANAPINQMEGAMSYIGKSIAVLFGVLLLSGFFAGICFADSFTISGTVWDMVPEGGPEEVAW